MILNFKYKTNAFDYMCLKFLDYRLEKNILKASKKTHRLVMQDRWKVADVFLSKKWTEHDSVLLVFNAFYVNLFERFCVHCREHCFCLGNRFWRDT